MKLSTKQRKELGDSEFGLIDADSGKRQFPLHDKNHVLLAMRFFKHCPKGKEKELASRINAKAKEYGIKIKPGSGAFTKYASPDIVSVSGEASNVGTLEPIVGGSETIRPEAGGIHTKHHQVLMSGIVQEHFDNGKVLDEPRSVISNLDGIVKSIILKGEYNDMLDYELDNNNNEYAPSFSTKDWLVDAYSQDYDNDIKVIDISFIIGSAPTIDRKKYLYSVLYQLDMDNDEEFFEKVVDNIGVDILPFTASVSPNMPDSAFRGTIFDMEIELETMYPLEQHFGTKNKDIVDTILADVPVETITDLMAYWGSRRYGACNTLVINKDKLAMMLSEYLANGTISGYYIVENRDNIAIGFVLGLSAGLFSKKIGFIYATVDPFKTSRIAFLTISGMDMHQFMYNWKHVATGDGNQVFETLLSRVMVMGEYYDGAEMPRFDDLESSITYSLDKFIQEYSGEGILEASNRGTEEKNFDKVLDCATMLFTLYRHAHDKNSSTERAYEMSSKRALDNVMKLDPTFDFLDFYKGSGFEALFPATESVELSLNTVKRV